MPPFGGFKLISSARRHQKVSSLALADTMPSEVPLTAPDNPSISPMPTAFTFGNCDKSAKVAGIVNKRKLAADAKYTDKRQGAYAVVRLFVGSYNTGAELWSQEYGA
jgi:hypothetical protein